MAGNPGGFAPPPDVLAAFGITDPVTRSPGGQGHAFRAGPWIVKPTSNAIETAWIADTLPSLNQTGVRLAPYKRAMSGDWVVSGWSAQAHLEGNHRNNSWPEIIAAGQALHRALSTIARPGFLSAKTDLWAVADRVAWGEQAHHPNPELTEALPPLLARLRPVTQPDQLIHGDLSGNVLFCDGQPPAIIDMTPYWRPVGFAAAVVVVDALTWEGAGPDLLSTVDALPDIHQLLLRAAIRRLVETAAHAQASRRELGPDLARHQATLDAIVAHGKSQQAPADPA